MEVSCSAYYTIYYFYNILLLEYTYNIIVVQSLVINIGICFASNYNVFRADDLSYGNVFTNQNILQP